MLLEEDLEKIKARMQQIGFNPMAHMFEFTAEKKRLQVALAASNVNLKKVQLPTLCCCIQLYIHTQRGVCVSGMCGCRHVGLSLGLSVFVGAGAGV